MKKKVVELKRIENVDGGQDKNYPFDYYRHGFEENSETVLNALTEATMGLDVMVYKHIVTASLENERTYLYHGDCGAKCYAGDVVIKLHVFYQ
jgi:hypothetical protein